MDKKINYMNEALKEAQKAYSIYEVPIGAIVVYKDKIIGRGHNLVETTKDPLAHAELIAIKEASEYLDSWRLIDCELFVTLEPCAMCAGAIVNSRIKKVYIAAMDEKRGCCGSNINILQKKFLNHNVDLEIGILHDECSMILSNFFKELRESRKLSHNKKLLGN